MKHVFAAVAFLLITAHRLPAPIVEENPTPAPKQVIKPKPKRSTQSKPDHATTPSRVVATPTPARSKKFAGTWSGIMPEVPWGNVPTELIVDQNESTMDWREEGKSKAGIMNAMISGGTLSARFAIGFTTAVWYISPRPDGTTANVKLTAFMNDQTAIFQRRTTP
jgi:hypothetical protein